MLISSSKAESSGFYSAAQDTVYMTLTEFMETALNRSNQLQSQRQSVGIAQSRHSEARASRYLPNLEANTAHGLVPGVKSQIPDLPRGQLYLDPNLENDWEDWAFFTRAEISAVQPLYTWGAIGNAIKAAESGVRAAEFGYETERNKYEMQMFQLYYAMVLSMELSRLMEEAKGSLRTADRELHKMMDEGSDDVEDADLFQFDIFKYQFEAEAEEIRQNNLFIQRAWRLALGGDRMTVYLPADEFLDPLDKEVESLDELLQMAITGRPELRQISAARQAAEYGLEAVKAERYPTFFLGLQARYAITPNRPKQDNPFIENRTNFASLVYGFGFRQRLNFGILNSRADRSRYTLRQASYARDAVTEAVELDVTDKYKDYEIALKRLNTSRNALGVSQEWLQLEQLDYDLGFGDVLNLVDALRTSFELEITHKQRIHDFNVNLARLYHVSGVSLNRLFNSQHSE